ncbi:MAG TPA: NAD-dependent succinate-semialdehyde dehydrogenase, partial [Candidatus Sulfotelmatobacter sp.]|nr:NAD-dependent succinate-semialdehyde dehydrogenase [Candidatus Sulfotelmatobacter sp.]
MASINPTTGQVMRQFEPHSDQEVERRLQCAADAFQEYRRIPYTERARELIRAAEILEAEKMSFGRIMTLEMGKPLRAAVQEAEKCAIGCRYYAENAERFLAQEEIKTNASRSFVSFQPLGPVLAVMPWNFPFWQVFRFAAPALMAGNVGLLKHASNVPQCALAIEEVFRRAGFPEGAFQTLLIGSKAVKRVIEDRRVTAVTLTGSVAAGASVASAAGKQIKKTVLELGGSDPFIVMSSADLDQAVVTAVQARTINNGQSCIAAKRFIVDRRIADAFERQFVERMAALKVGDPLQETTDIGPLATADVLDSLEEQVKQTTAMGARVLLGGKRLEGPGHFFAPTVLTDIPPGSPAHNDELFGPVASLFRAADMEEAIRIANDTPFGLGACAWTNDERERALFIDQIQSGLAFINGMVASDPRLPFGGVKQSGYGRELSSQGIREFVNIKTVVVQETGQS